MTRAALDIQSVSFCGVCCRYGHYVEGTGSVLHSCVEEDMEEAFRSLEQQPEEEKLRRLQRLKLRYFTPREIANLMGFPADFSELHTHAHTYIHKCVTEIQ